MNNQVKLSILPVALAVAALLLGGGEAHAQKYLRKIATSPIIEIRGETADSAALGADRYIEDNLDYVLKTNEWVAVNFSAYWCPDSDDFRPAFDSAATMTRYSGIRWVLAEVDGTRGNENFRSRFQLPGVPVVILFHQGKILGDEGTGRSILDGHEGDKTLADLLAMLETFYTQ